MSTMNKVVTLAANVSGVAGDKINGETRLDSGLGLDSLERIELRLAIEDAFDIVIPDKDADAPALETVGGIAAYVQGRLDAIATKHYPNPIMNGELEALRSCVAMCMAIFQNYAAVHMSKAREAVLELDQAEARAREIKAARNAAYAKQCELVLNSYPRVGLVDSKTLPTINDLMTIAQDRIREATGIPFPAR